jgi:hypothetical protein
MKIQAFMLSCPQRQALREETLADLRATDWGGEVVVVVDDTDHPRRQDRQERTSLRLLREALARPGWDHLLFLEDDLKFNRHLRHNLERWAPLTEGRVGLASLYNPGVRRLEELPCGHGFVADPDLTYGSQALLLARPCAAYVAEHYAEVPGMQDIKFTRLAARLGPLYYHTPSLVQHVGVRSAWGGSFHQAADFDAAFRAGEAPPERSWADLPGWFDFGDVYDLAVSAARDGDVLVELGCWLGRSTAYLAERIRRSGKRLDFYAVDHFRGTATEPELLRQVHELGGTLLPQFRDNMRRCGHADAIRVIVGDSADSAGLFADGSVAFVYIDADHSEEGLGRDIRAWLPKVRRGGWLAGHDYHTSSSVAETVRRLLPGHTTRGGSWLYEV